jgi:pyruvate-ferredoxin/flavodoxin oxidoreductase
MRPHPTGRFETLAADAIVLALGQETDGAFLRRVPGLEFAPDGAVVVDPDMMTGEQSVTVSVGHGKRAARHIDAWLRGERFARPAKHPLVTFDMLHLPVYSDADPSSQKILTMAERVRGFAEVVAGLSEKEARYEAQRCLSCGNCFECDNCYAACPEDAILKLGPGLRNIWGNVPVVQEMQSEGGAAGAVHGALQAGALTTTFTASQGLMLMIPNMFKIAGELTPTVFHVAARAVARHALSIFGDHSDVMATRSTGFALLSSGSVQEAHDMALIAEAATLRSRVPFLHFFDGFRTSHEVNTLTLLGDDQIRALIDDELVRTHRARALNPEHPFIRGTAQNPDTFFQGREAVNPFYAKVPDIVQSVMDGFAALTDRRYRLFDYDGPAEAERVLVLMGSGAETARETAAALRCAGEPVGVLQVRLFRPFSAAHFLAALPATCRAVAVLEQTKEPGAGGEPLYLNVVEALTQALARGERATMPRIIGGRYGLSSRDFSPAMAKAVFDELKRPEPKNGFTVGIIDDVSHTSLDVDPDCAIEADEVVRAVFYGLGADGTVGANKNSVKIIAEEAGLHAQGYFVYDTSRISTSRG